MYRVIYLLATAAITITALPIVDISTTNMSANDSFNDTECPTWYFPTSDGCTCGKSLGPLVKFHKSDQVSVLVAYCMSFDDASQQTLVGNCPYVNKMSKNHGSYILQPKNQSQLNENLCGWANREGFMCSRCKEGLGASVMTHEMCMECIGKWKGWALYIFLAMTPTTLFFVLIISCQIQGTSGYLNALVCLFQVMTFYVDKYPETVISTAADNAYSKNILLALTSIAGVWNLDFFRHVIPPFCISEHLTTLNIIAMEYIAAIYPLFLIIMTYIFIELYDKDFKPLQFLWAPFKWILDKMPWNIDIRYRLIDAFATFLQLTYSKLIFVSFNLLSYVAPYNSKGEHVYPNVLYFAGEVPYLSHTHLPYFVLAISVLIVFVMLPILLLFFYPTRTFQRCLGRIPGVNWLPLHAFADAFNGCFKNGTEGTKDYRYFGSFYLSFRVLFYLTSVISDVKNALIVTFIPLAASVMFGIFRPYKNNFFNILDAFMFSVLELCNIWVVYRTYIFAVPAFLIGLLLFIPFIYLLVLVLYKVMSLCTPSILVKLRRSACCLPISRAVMEHETNFKQLQQYI